MGQILIIYSSFTGNTEKMAKAVGEGIKKVKGMKAKIKKAGNATPADLVRSDALIVGSADYFGYMTGAVKDFFDRIYWEVREHVVGKPYGVFVTADGNGKAAVDNIDRVVGFFRMEKVADELTIEGTPEKKDLTLCRELGKKIAERVAERIS